MLSNQPNVKQFWKKKNLLSSTARKNIAAMHMAYACGRMRTCAFFRGGGDVKGGAGGLRSEKIKKGTRKEKDNQ